MLEQKPLQVDLLIETDEDLSLENKCNKYGCDKGEFVLGIDSFFLDAKYKIYIQDIIYISQVIYVNDLTESPIVIVGRKSFANHRGRRVVDVITEDTFENLADIGIEVLYTYVDLADPVNGRCTYSSGRYEVPPDPKAVIKNREQRIKIRDKEVADEVTAKQLAKHTQLKENERENRIANKHKKETTMEEDSNDLVSENPVQILKDHLEKDIIEVE